MPQAFAWLFENWDQSAQQAKWVFHFSGLCKETERSPLNCSRKSCIVNFQSDFCFLFFLQDCDDIRGVSPRITSRAGETKTRRRNGCLPTFLQSKNRTKRPFTSTAAATGAVQSAREAKCRTVSTRSWEAEHGNYFVVLEPEDLNSLKFHLIRCSPGLERKTFHVQQDIQGSLKDLDCSSGQFDFLSVNVRSFLFFTVPIVFLGRFFVAKMVSWMGSFGGGVKNCPASTIDFQNYRSGFLGPILDSCVSHRWPLNSFSCFHAERSCLFCLWFQEK